MDHVRRGMQLVLFACALAARSSGAVDITNRWVLEIDPPGSSFVRCLVDIQQVGTSFDVSGGCTQASITFAGTIDPTTGAFTGPGTIVSGSPPIVFDCTMEGSASPSGTTLTGTIECAGQLVTFTAGLCQNGNLDAGEACDTGFVTYACCTPACTIEPDDTPCTNANGCQTSEVCSSGTCVGAPRPSGATCDLDSDRCTEDTCDGGGACVAGPCSSCCRQVAGACVFDASCTRPTQPLSHFQLTTGSPTGSDRLAWKLPSLGNTMIAEFGDPTVSTDVAICPYYQNELYGPTLLAAFRAPAGSICGSRACWRSSRTGFRYRDRRARFDGLTSIVLKAGDGGIARIVARGRSANLPYWPGLPHPPLGVLLRAGASCWSAEYQSPFIDEQPGAIEATDGQ